MRLRAVLLSLLLLVSVPLEARAAEQREICDGTGHLIARLDDGGDLRSASGTLTGRIQGSTVRSATGSLLGRIDRDTLRRADGSLAARLNANGELRGPAGALAYRISASGDVRDRSGRLVLRVRAFTTGDVMPVAAYIVFFGPPSI